MGGSLIADFISAHKAAYPEKYSVTPSRLQDIEKVPTSVHLQIYDGEAQRKSTKRPFVNKILGAPHIFPILFTFTSSSKFCFRAIATFDKFVTGMKMDTSTRPGRWPFFFTNHRSRTDPNEDAPGNAPVLSSPPRTALKENLPMSTNGQSSFRQLFTRITQVRSIFPQKQRDELFGPQIESIDGDDSSSGIIGVRIEASLQMIDERPERKAGEP